jgi:hypothetical protein
MPETLTESFCERCGTRYEFAAPARLNTIRKTRGLISGLKNYIMSQDDLSDAVGDALRSEEETLASRQLDAFHQSFSFCIQCRQYTCTNCWNESAGRCRTCVPIPGTDDLIERFEASFHAHHPAMAGEGEMAQADLDRRLGMDAWPSEDLSRVATNGHVPADWPAEELGTAAEADVQPTLADVEVEPVAAETDIDVEPLAAETGPEPVVAEVEGEPEPESIAVGIEPEPVIAAAETMLPQPTADLPIPEGAVGAISWEADTTFELEPEPVVAEVEPEPEPVVAEVEPEPEPVVAEVEPEPEPVVAEVEPEPEPVVAEVEPEPEPEPQPEVELPAPTPIRPISETILPIPRPSPAMPADQDRVAASAADDPETAARRAKLELLGLGDPGEGAVGPERRPALPYRSSGAAVHPVELSGHQSAQAGAASGTFWEASAREVAGAVTQIGVQSCGHCGLSLSASARFCRRCGERQARSA